MRPNDPSPCVTPKKNRGQSSNVKSLPKHERFGDVIRYLTLDELRQFFDSIDHYTHKLMFQVIYELGCRVGEFVRIQIKHLDFGRHTVFFPAENTKTKYSRTSHLPAGVMNEVRSLLKQKGVLSKRDEKVLKPEAYMFYPGKNGHHHYTENRIRQVFQGYIRKTGLQKVYGRDKQGRQLQMFTVHSLRHSHIMHYTVEYELSLPIVQKQVGHRNLKTTSVYLSASQELVAKAYQKARMKADAR